MRTAGERRRRPHGYRVVEGQSEPLSFSRRPRSWSSPGQPGRRRTTRVGTGPFLEEFDWSSLRRAWDDEGDRRVEAEQEDRALRAQRSLDKLDAVLRARNLRRRLTPLLSAFLLPAAAYVTYRTLRAGRA